MTVQGGEELKGPSTAPAGGTIEIQVGPNETTVWVSSGVGDLTGYTVPPSKKVTIPVPPTPGEPLLVTVGRGLDKRSIIITIVAPSP